jgi:hypothetical protein
VVRGIRAGQDAQPVIDTLNKAMLDALKKPSVQQRLAASAPSRSAARQPR